MTSRPLLIGVGWLCGLGCAAAWAGDTPGGYDVRPPVEAGPSTSDWGFQARVEEAGPAQALGSSYWRPGEIAAGFGWREPGSYVLFGYEQGGRSAAPPLDFTLPGAERPWAPPDAGVLGLNIKLRTGDTQ